MDSLEMGLERTEGVLQGRQPGQSLLGCSTQLGAMGLVMLMAPASRGCSAAEMALLHFSSPGSAERGLDLLWSISLVPNFTQA